MLLQWVRLLSLLTSKAERRKDIRWRQAGLPPRASGIPFGLVYRPKRDSLYGGTLTESTKTKRKKKNNKDRTKIEHTLPLESRSATQQRQSIIMITQQTALTVLQFYRTVFSPRFALRARRETAWLYSRQLKGQEAKRISGKTATIPTIKTVIKENKQKKEKNRTKCRG